MAVFGICRRSWTGISDSGPVMLEAMSILHVPIIELSFEVENGMIELQGCFHLQVKER